MERPLPPDSPPPGQLIVRPEESGMKLLRFLERRLDGEPPKNQLHKWIRTGQVRLNGGRAKAFSLLTAGDAVRVPPFALVRHIAPEAETEAGALTREQDEAISEECRRILGPDLPVLAADRDILVLVKPGGLASQPGSGQEDSVSSRLTRAFSGQAFIPAPAHRLDKHSSGLLVAARNHAAQRRLHELFKHGGAGKEYLAWAAGTWPHAAPCVLRDMLVQGRDAGGRERMEALPGQAATLPITGGLGAAFFEHEEDGAALCIALPVQLTEDTGIQGYSRATLFLIRLLTGRKHQIRVQLSSRGLPIIGDGRYGGPPYSRMLLHAWTLTLPPFAGEAAPMPASGEEREFTALPAWPARFVPDTGLLLDAQKRLRALLPPA